MTAPLHVTTSHSNGVLVVRLDEPASRNALSAAMLASLAERLEEAAADPQVGAAVLAGGERYFASGADLRELRASTGASYLAGPRSAAWRCIRNFPKPVVAAVAGYALGGGCELALTCDAIVAGDRSTFGQPEVKVGLLPGAGGTQRWARAHGRYAAASIVLAGRIISAWEARELGIVHRLVPDEHVVDAAVDMSRTFLDGAPLAVRHAKRSLRLSEEVPLEHALEHERTLLATLLDTDDLREGIDAFLHRRPPVFRGS